MIFWPHRRYEHFHYARSAMFSELSTEKMARSAPRCNRKQRSWARTWLPGSSGFYCAVIGCFYIVTMTGCSNLNATSESTPQTAQEEQSSSQEPAGEAQQNDESLKVMVDDTVLYGAVSESSEVTEPMLTARLFVPRHSAPFTMQVELFDEYSRCQFTMSRSTRFNSRPQFDIEFQAGTADITRFDGHTRCLTLDPSEPRNQERRDRGTSRYCNPDGALVIHGFAQVEDFDMDSATSLQHQAEELSRARGEAVQERLEGTLFEDDVAFVKSWGMALKSYERDPMPPEQFESATGTGATVIPVDSHPGVSMVSVAPAADDEILEALVELRAGISRETSLSFHSSSLRVDVRGDIAEQYGLQGDTEFSTSYQEDVQGREFVSWIRDFIDYSCERPIEPPSP